MRLYTSRLVLRPWEPSDAPRLCELTRDPGFRQYSIMFSQPLDLENARILLKELAFRPHPALGRWAIEHQGEVIGNAALQPQLLDDASEEQVEVGYRLAQSAWGQGFATEAAGRLLEHGRELGLSEIFAFIEPSNAASQKVARRLKMQKRAEARFHTKPVEVWSIIYTAGEPEPRR